MSTKDLRTPGAEAHTVCDVCGRTLLRGEHAHAYLDGGNHRSVCELCTARALQEGWIREGSLPAYDASGAGAERRRSLLGKLRRRRDAPPPEDGEVPPVAEDQNGYSPPRLRPIHREPRHVRAIPSSDEQKRVSAIEAFNGSERRRTVAGVARSLGPPIVSVNPVSERPSLVNLTVAWELCWYRYEVDLAEELDVVRVSAQGNELDELDSSERTANAVCDERGQLSLGG